MFQWGQLKIGSSDKFIGHLETVSVNCKLFKPDGAPIRAEVDLKLKDLPADADGQNPTSRGLTTYRIHSLRRDESLQSITFDEYGDARLWRAVAAINHIDDPFRILPGTQLRLPTETDLRTWTASDA